MAKNPVFHAPTTHIVWSLQQQIRSFCRSLRSGIAWSLPTNCYVFFWLQNISFFFCFFVEVLNVLCVLLSCAGNNEVTQSWIARTIIIHEIVFQSYDKQFNIKISRHSIIWVTTWLIVFVVCRFVAAMVMRMVSIDGASDLFVCLAMALSVSGMKLSDFATMKRRIVTAMAGARVIFWTW